MFELTSDARSSKASTTISGLRQEAGESLKRSREAEWQAQKASFRGA